MGRHVGSWAPRYRSFKVEDSCVLIGRFRYCEPQICGWGRRRRGWEETWIIDRAGLCHAAPICAQPETSRECSRPSPSATCRAIAFGWLEEAARSVPLSQRCYARYLSVRFRVLFDWPRQDRILNGNIAGKSNGTASEFFLERFGHFNDSIIDIDHFDRCSYARRGLLQNVALEFPLLQLLLRPSRPGRSVVTGRRLVFIVRAMI